MEQYQPLIEQLGIGGYYLNTIKAQVDRGSIYKNVLLNARCKDGTQATVCIRDWQLQSATINTTPEQWGEILLRKQYSVVADADALRVFELNQVMDDLCPDDSPKCFEITEREMDGDLHKLFLRKLHRAELKTVRTPLRYRARQLGRRMIDGTTRAQIQLSTRIGSLLEG